MGPSRACLRELCPGLKTGEEQTSERPGVLSEVAARTAQVPCVRMAFTARLWSQTVLYVLISDFPFLINMWKTTSMIFFSSLSLFYLAPSLTGCGLLWQTKNK